MWSTSRVSRPTTTEVTPVQLMALQRYISAVAWFMLHHVEGDGNITELMASKAHLEASFGVTLPSPKPVFPDIL